jgi:hypothetical protein
VQPVIALAELLDRPLDRGRLVLDLAEEPDLTRAAALGDRQRRSWNYKPTSSGAQLVLGNGV